MVTISSPMRGSNQTISRLRPLASLALAVALVVGAGTPVRAQDQEAIARVRDLNKKAVEAYENLDPEESRKFLMQALEVCAAEGLNRHTVKATTHVNLGVVLVGGFKQRDNGVKQFRRAVEIDPNIRVPKRLSNPEIQAAFDEAKKEPVAETPAVAEAPVAPEPVAPAAPIRGINHTPVTDGRIGESVLIRATADGIRFERMVLAYRPEGAAEFLARDMERDNSGEYTARIPEPATHNGSVSYYIEGRNRTNVAIGSSGSPTEPYVVAFSAAPPPEEVARSRSDEEISDEGRDVGSRRSRRGGMPLYFGMGVGGGGGWVKGKPEVNPYYNKDMKKERIAINSVAAANLLHFTPEIGYFFSRDLLLSLQGRLQLTTGGTEAHDPSCKPSGVCEPATGAIAVLARATWYLSNKKKANPAFRPFVALNAGAGFIRYLVDVSSYVDGCGPISASKPCHDTVAGGGALLGPGAGFSYRLSDGLSFIAAANALLGVPKTAVNFDLNLGVGYRL